MKASDFEKKHTPVKMTPPLQADVDKLQAMHAGMMQHSRQANECVATLIPLDGTQYVQFGPGMMAAIPPAETRFYGLAFCTSCLREAALHLRDLAIVCEDLANEGDKTL